MCFEVHQAFKEAHAAFDQGRGFEDLSGEGGDFVIFSVVFFNIHVIDMFTTY